MATKQGRARTTIEFGDFQTPMALALATTQLLRHLGVRPRSILEPTCGRGAFIAAASQIFPEAASILGMDVNCEHIQAAKNAVGRTDRRIDLQSANFFTVDWGRVVTKDAGPWLILGNPPWVTSSDLGAIDSSNVPEKSNVHGRPGIEAITGKSNFDISEWMLLRYLDWLQGSKGTMAVLCKSAVARKVLLHAWKKKIPLHDARIYRIDAGRHFGVAVDACFFILSIDPSAQAHCCEIFDTLTAQAPSHTLSFHGGCIVSDMEAFDRYRGLIGSDEHYVWRSGIKHDCTRVMELAVTPQGYRNGLGETLPLEDTMLYPMLKGSDIGNGRVASRRVMIVTQRFIGEDTRYIRTVAPKTWDYLNRHAALLDGRGSAIYKNKPAFSIFGVGQYSFAPWKVAICGLYKQLRFVKVGPINGRPVVLDDTTCFLPCWSEEEAGFLEDLVCSNPAQALLHSMIQWEDKRPVTAEILKRLGIGRLATLLGREKEYIHFTVAANSPRIAIGSQSNGAPVSALPEAEQLRLF